MKIHVTSTTEYEIDPLPVPERVRAARHFPSGGQEILNLSTISLTHDQADALIEELRESIHALIEGARPPIDVKENS